MVAAPETSGLYVCGAFVLTWSSIKLTQAVTCPQTHIPKKEVQELLQERHIPTVSFQGELQASNTSKIKLTKMKIVPRYLVS